jgi:hypothetical protein
MRQYSRWLGAFLLLMAPPDRIDPDAHYKTHRAEKYQTLLLTEITSFVENLRSSIS